MIALLRLVRPHFLLGGALLFALGVTATGGVSPTAYVLGQAMVSAIQLTAHVVNEYADAAADARVLNRTWFSGGSGAIADGSVDRHTALRVAWITSGVSLVAIGLVAARSPLAGAIGTAALAVAWAYSIDPIRLLATGTGEIATTLVVAAGVPLTGALADGGPVTGELWWAIGVLLPIHLGMMLGFEVPDLESDRDAGKRVLAVRLGFSATRRCIVTLFVAGGAILAAGLVTGTLPPGAAWAASAAAPAVMTTAGMARERWAVVTIGSVTTLVVATLGLIGGLSRDLALG